MLQYFALIVIELLFWWRLRSDYREEGSTQWRYVRLVKAFFTLVLIYALMKVLLMRGDMAVPKNAFSLIFLGAVAAMTVVSGLFYIMMSLIRLALAKISGKRVIWLKWITTGATAILFSVFIYGYFLGRFDIRTDRKEITIEGADERIDGLRIALISDLHLSSFYHHYDKLSGAISEININRPDILINTGDFVSYGWQELQGCDTILRKARPALGAFAISGNHDDCSYDTDLDLGSQATGKAMVDSLIRRSGYTLLNDTSVVINYHGAKIRIAGIVTRGHRFNIRYGDAGRALPGRADSATVIFLVHDPSYWDNHRAIARNAHLTLSGHTHGMQVGFPVRGGYWSPAKYLFKYWGGLYEENGRYLYVSRGFGTMSMAERIFMPPEITIITIRAGKKH